LEKAVRAIIRDLFTEQLSLPQQTIRDTISQEIRDGGIFRFIESQEDAFAQDENITPLKDGYQKGSGNKSVLLEETCVIMMGYVNIDPRHIYISRDNLIEKYIIYIIIYDYTNYYDIEFQALILCSLSFQLHNLVICYKKISFDT